MKMRKPRRKAAPKRGVHRPLARSRLDPRRAQAKNTPRRPVITRPVKRPPPRAREELPEAEAKTTTDLEVIKAWTEKRGGKPATVKGTAPEHEAGMLRIEFPGRGADENLESISWEDWYRKFEEKELAFLYQEETKDGKESRFFKLVSRK